MDALLRMLHKFNEVNGKEQFSLAEGRHYRMIGTMMALVNLETETVYYRFFAPTQLETGEFLFEEVWMSKSYCSETEKFFKWVISQSRNSGLTGSLLVSAPRSEFKSYVRVEYAPLDLSMRIIGSETRQPEGVR